MRTEAEAIVESQHLLGIQSKKKPLAVSKRSYSSVRSGLEATQKVGCGGSGDEPVAGCWRCIIWGLTNNKRAKQKGQHPGVPVCDGTGLHEVPA